MKVKNLERDKGFFKKVPNPTNRLSNWGWSLYSFEEVLSALGMVLPSLSSFLN